MLEINYTVGLVYLWVDHLRAQWSAPGLFSHSISPGRLAKARSSAHVGTNARRAKPTTVAPRSPKLRLCALIFLNATGPERRQRSIYQQRCEQRILEDVAQDGIEKVG